MHALAQRLWLPVPGDICASPWTSWNGCSAATLQNSWFSSTLKTSTKLWQLNSEIIYSPSLLSAWLAVTDGGPQQITRDSMMPPPSKKQRRNDEETIPSALKTRRTRVYPTPQQRARIRQWFGTARWVFNQCLALVKLDPTKRNKHALRAAIVNNDSPMASAFPWLLETPYQIRDAAMIDVLNAYTTNFAKPGHKFDVHYRSSKAPQAAIAIRKIQYSKGVFYPTFFGKEAIRSSELLPDTIAHDSKLIQTRLGHYYLCVTMPLTPASENQARRLESVVALDPGVRTFQTAYDPSGKIIEFGKNDIGHIYRICHHMDKLQSRIDTDTRLRHKARYRTQRALRKMHWRIRNLVDDCHKKMVKFLCSNYDVVLLPSFETKRMVARSRRKIRSKTARAMMTWAHYQFKQRLLFKRQEYPWCKVVICDEAYTSKTCGRCGALHQKLGGNKTFKCPSCCLVLDRDVNGARNILLKNASLFGFRAGVDVGSYPLPGFC